ncbi:TPA: hypothetical protein N0F65_004683 [Lagenidium giganteum]|uniref:Uncharacterized protein n=1 Tax=Lagenidium giganteum TaxID=4803 RepID=A0AAV2Z0B0_9STRA|nr:TPA: hypothetical protein N0F65_004683 [Lagenidium giganteum]
MADTQLKRERDDVDPELVSSLHEKPSDAQKTKSEDSSTGKRWTSEQDDALRSAVEEFGQRNWKAIASRVPGRNHAQCLQRWNKVLKPGLVKGHWSYEEDSILERMVLQGCHSWAEVATAIPGRTAKQCRERWRNHLDPSINKSPFTPEEDITIQRAYETLGNRWTQIAELLPGRTEDAVKLRWKALNPNQKTNAKPGRPRLMPGMNANKPRSTAPPSPADVATNMASAAPLGVPMSADMAGMYAHPPPAGYVAELGAHIDPMMSQMRPGMQGVQPAHTGPNGLPEPSVEPLSGDANEVVDSKEAAMLKELLRSGSNSLLSFGSSRGLSSFNDMSPEELMASGELDDLLRQVSLANDNSVASSRSLESKTKLTESFKQSLGSLGRQEDKEMFQQIYNGLHGDENLPHDPNMYKSYSSQSGRNLLHSLEYEGERDDAPPGIAAAMNSVADDIDELDLLRPIRKGVQY